jgi:hypothetical protein
MTMSKQVDINVDMVCVHEEVLNGKLRLYLCLFNYDSDIPKNWFKTTDNIDLKLHFSIDLIVDSIIQNYELWDSNSDAVVFRKQDKLIVDQLIAQLKRGLRKLQAVTYEAEEL